MSPFDRPQTRQNSRGFLLEGSLLASQVAGLAVSILIARVLGPDGRGAVTKTVVWSQLAGWIAGYSLDKWLAATFAGRASAIVESAVRSAQRFVLAMMFPISTLAAIVWFAHPATYDLRVLLPAALLTALSEIHLGRLLAQQDLREYAVSRIIQPLCYLGFCLVVIAVGAPATVSKFLAGFLASMLVGYLVVRHVRRSTTAAELRSSAHWGVFGTLSTIHVGSMLQYLNQRIDLLVLALVSDDATVGQYAVASAGGTLVYLVGGAGLARRLSRTDLANRGEALVLGLLAGAGSVLAPVMIPLVFGAEFRPAVVPAVILVWGGFFGAKMQSVTGQLLANSRYGLVNVLHLGGPGIVVVVAVVSKGDLLATAGASAASYALPYVLSRCFDLIVHDDDEPRPLA